ncbi:hypothetical protein [Amycolatopsis plumensis]|uniref:hypothetical protein n=1 Tax=Amycolatopsis plumensis TaxID=236508 RepID=UPI0036201970
MANWSAASPCQAVESVSCAVLSWSTASERALWLAKVSARCWTLPMSPAMNTRSLLSRVMMPSAQMNPAARRMTASASSG